METKNFIVEVIDAPADGNGLRTFIVRELAPRPDMPARVRLVSTSTEELAAFFGSDELFK